MFCAKCGTDNADNTWKCVKCGEVLRQGPAAPPAQPIPNYLVQSILVTALCCLPLGIPAIIFAAQVNGKVQAGDIQGAINSSNKAKMWAWISFGLGLTWLVLYGALMAFSVISA